MLCCDVETHTHTITLCIAVMTLRWLHCDDALCIDETFWLMSLIIFFSESDQTLTRFTCLMNFFFFEFKSLWKYICWKQLLPHDQQVCVCKTNYNICNNKFSTQVSCARLKFTLLVFHAKKEGQRERERRIIYKGARVCKSTPPVDLWRSALSLEFV